MILSGDFAWLAQISAESGHKLSKVHREVEGPTRPQGSNDALHVSWKTANLLCNPKKDLREGYGLQIVCRCWVCTRRNWSEKTLVVKRMKRGLRRSESWWNLKEGDVTIAHNAEIIAGDNRNDENKSQQDRTETCSSCSNHIHTCSNFGCLNLHHSPPKKTWDAFCIWC